MILRLVTAPTVEPVSLTEAKTQCRVDIADDDTYISALITAARSHLEMIARPQLAMITQTWECLLDDWPGGDTLELRPYPLQSVTSVKYTDQAGAETTYSSANYLVDTYSEPGRLRLKTGASWPSASLRELNGVAIRFVAGYGAAGTAVDMQLRQAILLLVAHWYENREPVLTTGAQAVSMPFTVTALMQHWRREG